MCMSSDIMRHLVEGQAQQDSDDGRALAAAGWRCTGLSAKPETMTWWSPPRPLQRRSAECDLPLNYKLPVAVRMLADAAAAEAQLTLFAPEEER